MKYKSVEKYLNKGKNKTKRKNSIIQRFLTKLSICIILFLVCLIFLRTNETMNEKIHNILKENNINIAVINNWYQKHFGDIIPFQNLVKSKTKLVFNENLIYDDPTPYKNGVKLKVGKNYLTPAIESGIVVFIGNKEEYSNTVIIEQIDGIDVWYGNIENPNVSLYDYVSKGEFIGEANNNLYMLFEKEGKYLSYKNYIK